MPNLDPVFEALAKRERHFQILIEQAADGILVVDGQGCITLANSRSCEMTGYGTDEIVGLDLLETYLPDERERGRLGLGEMPAATVVRFERLLRRKDGSSFPIDVSVAWLPDGERQFIMRDISAYRRVEDDLRCLAAELERRVDERTRAYEAANAELEAANAELGEANGELQLLLREQERLQAELAFRAMHDPLTGLANRAMFAERIQHAFRVGERGAAVLWIDLDRFKEVNDIFGHDVGDEMLVAVADRLREVVRETDDIARMGGDEFAIVLPNVIESEAQMVAERVLSALSDRDAFRLQLDASLGIAWQREAGGDGRGLIRRADEAMYRAKAVGGGVAVTY
jgi:diguanylate cyclase (GGDEF)-like protein/PAS domain S-box-containing protein